MKLRIDPHTIEQMHKRGTNEEEIQQVLNSERELPAKHGRKKKIKIFPFNSTWGGKFYKEKMVEVIYAEENGNIITVTVYVYFGSWT